MSKTLNVTQTKDLSGIEVFGKAMDVGCGCLVQVTTQQGVLVAEALIFVPGVSIKTDELGNK